MKTLFVFLIVGVSLSLTLAIDNGLGITPPRGWRSWNLFQANINDTVMRGQMHAVLDTSRTVGGKPTTLASLGFDYISMDDGWQKCNCSTPGSVDPKLPQCPNCRTGACSWHTSDADGGKPVVNLEKFPDMKGLVDYGHSLGLKVGGYLNNCVCMEGGDPPMGLHCTSPTHYEQDVEFIVSTGFDGVKIDNCGSSHNMTLWAELFNKSGRPVRIESCHTFHPNNGTPSGWPNFPVWSPEAHAKDVQCPMNMYRTGGDISASFSSILGESYAVVQYADRPDPFSHPGCWAYPDMQEIGNFNGADPQRSDEERTHWGLWCIMSAPLVLGFDLTDKVTMDRVWSTITNTDALAINDAWAGLPGTLVKSYPSTDPSVPFVVDQGPCDGSAATLGWHLDSGKLYAPGEQNKTQPQCLGTQSGPIGQDAGGILSCPPPTTASPKTGCGVLFENCSDIKGSWTWNATTGLLFFTQDSNTVGMDEPTPSLNRMLSWSSRSLDPEHFNLTWQTNSVPSQTLRRTPPKPQCLQAKGTAPVGGFYGGPVSAFTGVGGCPSKSSNTSNFAFSDKKELQLPGGNVCLRARPLWGVQLWSKPLPNGEVAILVINIADRPQKMSVPIADIPQLKCGTSCQVRDVWNQKNMPDQTETIDVDLRVHESAFFKLSPSKNES
eukprot:m.19038 g.19038  ORF g.19038 m.19038 type:complete len:663 (-) comp6470_c0_seq1:97-2085(-)